MAMTRRGPDTSFFINTSGIVANNNTSNKAKPMMNDNKLPGGVLSAVLTPLDNNLNADYAI